MTCSRDTSIQLKDKCRRNQKQFVRTPTLFKVGKLFASGIVWLEANLRSSGRSRVIRVGKAR